MNIKHKIQNSSLPLTVSIEPNNICNAKCSFCAYGKENNEIIGLKPNDRPVLDKRKKMQVSDEIIDYFFKLCKKDGGGLLKKLSISPNLGEVSINSRWIDMIKKAKLTKGINNISSFSNAINFHRIGINKIIESGITNLEISTSLVDRESYKRLYGRDKYDQVLKNILDLLSENKRRGFPIDIYINLRVDLPIENFTKSKVYKDLTKYIEKNKISYLTDYDTWGGVINKNDIPIGAKLLSVKNNRGKPPCLQLYKTLYVNIDGTIQACKCIPHESLNTENILDHNSLHSAWRNKKYNKIRNNWENKNLLQEACVTCTHYMPYTKLISYYSMKTILRTRLRNIVSGTKFFRLYKKIFAFKSNIRHSKRDPLL